MGGAVGLFHGPFFVYINDLYAHRLLQLTDEANDFALKKISKKRFFSSVKNLNKIKMPVFLKYC
ncbi:hypothetical protein LNTAR_14827 [Lentisphaera araneosa HTCC2155]|jgi:hypothetical protein|uniref:Uncharacterized protein n=1 Tax=Lentisphaera araneosa HTCC2155 TaxID=313628 RepID=A6DHL7_9BACT|nr:hypothetical protein LNTAR_14827 [Lentisphaera araneosa HTCC2155]